MVTEAQILAEALNVWLNKYRHTLPLDARVAIDGIACGRPDIYARCPENVGLNAEQRRQWAAGTKAAAEAMREAALYLGAPVPEAARVVCDAALDAQMRAQQ